MKARLIERAAAPPNRPVPGYDDIIMPSYESAHLLAGNSPLEPGATLERCPTLQRFSISVQFSINVIGSAVRETGLITSARCSSGETT